MSIWRKLAMVFTIMLFGVGLWILGYDLWFIRYFGFDFNDVIYLGGEDFSDWPTGERPSWAIVPLFAYSFPFLIVGFLIFIIRPKPHYRGRIHLGTE